VQETVVGNRYNIVRALGGGGMAQVYLAHDEILDRDVALKVLREHLAEDEEIAERFKREALSAAALSHPNIVSVYDRGQEAGTSYIAMEYVPGGTLKERILRDGPLGAGVATSVALQIAEALHVAHQRGVIHRDIKPHNVLLTSSGNAKVADFGIARAASAATISQRSMVLGTASYMSPEQAMGETVMPTSDLYSLGVVLYEMLTGELPYTAENPVAVSMKHVNDPLRPPRELNPEIPGELNALITKLLAKDPDCRYESAAQLADDLRRLRDGLPPIGAGLQEEGTGATRVAPRATVSPSARRGGGLRTPWILTATLALVALLGGIAWALSQSLGESGTPLGWVAGVEVPSARGLTQEQARPKLGASGFKADVRLRESSAAEAGKVLGQSPAAGERAGEGSTVVLNVGDGPSTLKVPEVVGLSVSEAKGALGEVGLNLGEQRMVPSDTAAEGIIVDQDHRAGTEVEPGTAVNVGVSSGQQPAAVPGDADQSSQASATASATATATATAPATTTALEDDNSGPGSSDSGGSGPGNGGED
jgi:tRNA A-37 threonylcarbamoyl transferase component Bud32